MVAHSPGKWEHCYSFSNDSGAACRKTGTQICFVGQWWRKLGVDAPPCYAYKEKCSRVGEPCATMQCLGSIMFPFKRRACHHASFQEADVRTRKLRAPPHCVGRKECSHVTAQATIWFYVFFDRSLHTLLQKRKRAELWKNRIQLIC